MENTFLPKRARAFLAGALAIPTAAVSASAQTGGKPAPPPAASTSPPSPVVSASELTSQFVATAVPTTNFIATASRMAVSKSHNAKVQKFAAALATDQTAIANSLAGWINVNGPVVTLRSPYTGQIGPGAAKLKAPKFAPVAGHLLAASIRLERA